MRPYGYRKSDKENKAGYILWECILAIFLVSILAMLTMPFIRTVVMAQQRSIYTSKIVDESRFVLNTLNVYIMLAKPRTNNTEGNKYTFVYRKYNHGFRADYQMLYLLLNDGQRQPVTNYSLKRNDIVWHPGNGMGSPLFKIEGKGYLHFQYGWTYYLTNEKNNYTISSSIYPLPLFYQIGAIYEFK